jgi:hypothetical protein
MEARPTTGAEEANRPARTLLEQMIRERGQTLDEFVEYVEVFAREHHERGTLSLRHLQRLIAGQRSDGTPLGPTRPATSHLLERIFGVGVRRLLSPPNAINAVDNSGAELRQRLRAARQVDAAVIDLLREQLDAIRRLDRQMGAIVAYDEVRTKAAQITRLQSYSVSPATRVNLATLLSEISALAGWEALDQNNVDQAWDHHERARLAAREAHSPALLAHATAQQAVILTDLRETAAAVEQLAGARALAERSAPALVRSWLAAAHGEGLAAAGLGDDARRAFDAAYALLPTDPVDPALPFLFLAGAHLDRWRGHALARLGDPEAVPVLTDALHRLDPTFTRAATALRVDLAIALTDTGERDEARAQVQFAGDMAAEIGSARQQGRIRALSIADKVS